MADAAALHLSVREPAQAPPRRQERHGPGFTVERIVIKEAVSFEYAWTGTRHYLALHDLRLSDGELMVDGLAPVRSRDLRDTFTYIPSGCGVSGWSVLGPRTDAFTMLSFDSAALGADIGERLARLDPEPRLYFRSEALRRPMARLGELLDEESVDLLHVDTLVTLALVELLGLVPPEGPGRLAPWQLAAVLEHVEDGMAEGISLDGLAAAAGLSRFHFSRAFKASTGVSPYAFALARRVDRAEELLRAGQPLTAAAAATGFAGGAQLRRALRERKGRQSESASQG